jgi:hypothetical protein
MSDKDMSIWDSHSSKWSRWHGQFTMYAQLRCCLHTYYCSHSVLSFIGSSSQDIRLTHTFSS